MAHRWLLIILLIAYPQLLFAGRGAAPQRPAGPPGTATISGTVLRRGTKEPIAGVQVSIRGNVGTPLTPPPPITSDDQGRFSIGMLDAGTYRISFSSAGYVPQEYGQRFIGGTARPATGDAVEMITVGAGQSMTGLTVQLTPTSILSGHVRDINGRPLPSIRVQLVRTEYDDNGQRIFRSVASGRSDDHGEYRIANVVPERYYLVAGGASTRSNNPNELPETTATAFYPGVPDAASAALVDIAPGIEKSGVDFNLKTQALHRIRGRVVDAEGSGMADRATVSYSSPSLLSGSGESQGLYDPATATVEIRDLAPGRYTVRVQASYQGTGRGARFTTHSAVNEITVGDDDVDDVVWTTRLPSTIKGRFVIDGPAPAGPVRMSLNFRSVNYGPVPSSNPADANGVFEIQNVIPGEYRANPLAIAAPLYVKSIRYGGVDILGKSFRFEANNDQTIEVVLGSGLAQITGTAIDERQQPAAAFAAILIPDQRDRYDLYRTARRPPNGSRDRFTIPNVPPGGYKLFAWDGVEQNAYFDPEWLRQYESQGNHLQIEASSNVAVDVKVITTADRSQ